jgi:hypothetical protein
MQRPFVTMLFVAGAGVLLPWLAVTLDGLASLWQIERRVVFHPSSLERIALSLGIFLLVGLAWGAALGAVVSKSRLSQFAVLSGLVASAAWFIPIASLGIPGSVATGLSLFAGVVAGAHLVGGARREA